MEAIEFIRCGEPHGISSSPHWSYRSVPAGAKTGSYYPKAEADAEIARLEMKLRAICPHKKFYEISFEDGYPGGDIATYECEYCGYHFTGELPQ